jgi:hypothetical protein
MKIKYALLHDFGTGWFTHLIAHEDTQGDNPKIIEHHDVDSGISAQVIVNIFQRDYNKIMNFNGVIQPSGSFYYFSISYDEFHRIVNLVKLYPDVKRYTELQK